MQNGGMGNLPAVFVQLLFAPNTAKFMPSVPARLTGFEVCQLLYGTE